MLEFRDLEQGSEIWGYPGDSDSRTIDMPLGGGGGGEGGVLHVEMDRWMKLCAHNNTSILV